MELHTLKTERPGCGKRPAKICLNPSFIFSDLERCFPFKSVKSSVRSFFDFKDKIQGQATVYKYFFATFDVLDCDLLVLWNAVVDKILAAKVNSS